MVLLLITFMCIYTHSLTDWNLYKNCKTTTNTEASLPKTHYESYIHSNPLLENIGTVYRPRWESSKKTEKTKHISRYSVHFVRRVFKCWVSCHVLNPFLYWEYSIALSSYQKTQSAYHEASFFSQD